MAPLSTDNDLLFSVAVGLQSASRWRKMPVRGQSRGLQQLQVDPLGRVDVHVNP